MRLKFPKLLLPLFLVLTACFDTGPDTREGVTVKEAIEAIKTGKFHEYRKYTVNGQDILNTVVGEVGPYGDKQMSASLLKPKEDRRIRASFERVAEGGEGMIDFHREHFSGIKLLSKENWVPAEVVPGMRKIREIPVAVYGVITKEGGDAGASRFPQFVLTTRDNRPYIIELRLPPTEELYIPTDSEIEALQPNAEGEELDIDVSEDGAVEGAEE